MYTDVIVWSVCRNSQIHSFLVYFCNNSHYTVFEIHWFFLSPKSALCETLLYPQPKAKISFSDFFIISRLQIPSVFRNQHILSAVHFQNRYSRASHNADFGDKKNQCISKTVYCGLIYRDRVSAKFLHTLYTIKSVYIKFLEVIENPVSAKSVLKEAVYNGALLYLDLPNNFRFEL